MKNKSYMSISEFAHLTGIKRANLIFYDKIGLLSPDYRGANDYRYYSRRQLGSAYLIVALRDMSIGLDEIRKYADGRTPERMISLFETQEKRILSEIEKLNRMREIMKLYIDLAHDVPAGGIDEIIVREQKQEPLFRGADIDPHQSDDQSTIEFYEYALKHSTELGYPFGVAVDVKNLSRDIPEKALWFYFKVQQKENEFKPAGRYAVAYGYCAYGHSDLIYSRLLHYIKEHELTVCGNAYEEYPLNEISIQNDQDYLVKVEIMVE